VSRRRPVTVLVYHADEADQYAALVRAPRGRVAVKVAAKPEEAAPVVGEADVLYTWKFPPSLYREAKRLRWLQAMAAGVEWALVPELPPRVVLTRAPGIFGPWMAEYALGWMLRVTQRMAEYGDAQRERRWIGTVMPDRLRGKTLAIVGLGDIGRTIARAAGALGMRVIGVSRSGRPAAGVGRVFRLGGLHRALAVADFVVLTVPLTEDTRGLIDGAALAAMRPSAWLVNVARGPIVVEEALVAALRERRIGGAVLDVFDREPLPADHPLWTLPNAALTPHISGPSTPDEIAPIFNDNLARFLAGRRLRHVVDRRRGY
jgi:glyoxylate/hydroxypyruvate reductase A